MFPDMPLFTTEIGTEEGQFVLPFCVNHNLDSREDFISNTYRTDYAKVMICFCQIIANAHLSVTLNWYRNYQPITRYFIPVIC